ncbi:hypothetical protein CSC82_34715, partial [Rhodobacteraceae bacterium 4F10]
MKKVYYVFAVWRKKDVKFINNLNTSNKIEIGADSFSIQEGEDYDKFTEYYSKKDTLFYKTKPKEFKIKHATSIFSKEELDEAKYYAVSSIPPYESPSSRYPQPNKRREYVRQVFKGDFYMFSEIYHGVNYKKQIAPFQIKKPKWKKNEVCFNLGLEYEYTCFKKGFYQEVLAPLGLQCMEVLDYKTGKPLEDTVQLIIPTAKSKLLLENSSYDIHPLEETNGVKQYALQILDF